MAAAQMRMMALSLALIMAIMSAYAPTMGSCSSFIVYAGPECNNLAIEYNACGCSNIDASTHGGYIFTYQGQTAAAYNTANCQGVAQTHFSGSAEGCSPFGWQSFFIQC